MATVADLLAGLPDVLTPDQIAERLNAAPGVVRDWCRTGRIVAFKIPGREWRIRRIDLERAIELNRRNEPVPSASGRVSRARQRASDAILDAAGV